MEQSDPAVIVSGATDMVSPSTAWKEFWLLSYLLPYLLLFVIIAISGNFETSGYSAFLAIFGPFVLGIIGTILSLASSRLPLWLSTFYFIVTLIGYFLGFVIFCIVIALIFGVVAT
jgi:hypothetical protein